MALNNDFSATAVTGYDITFRTTEYGFDGLPIGVNAEVTIQESRDYVALTEGAAVLFPRLMTNNVVCGNAITGKTYDYLRVFSTTANNGTAYYKLASLTKSFSYSSGEEDRTVKSFRCARTMHITASVPVTDSEPPGVSHQGGLISADITLTVTKRMGNRMCVAWMDLDDLAATSSTPKYYDGTGSSVAVPINKSMIVIMLNGTDHLPVWSGRILIFNKV